MGLAIKYGAKLNDAIDILYTVADTIESRIKNQPQELWDTISKQIRDTAQLESVETFARGLGPPLNVFFQDEDESYTDLHLGYPRYNNGNYEDIGMDWLVELWITELCPGIIDDVKDAGIGDITSVGWAVTIGAALEVGGVLAQREVAAGFQYSVTLGLYVIRATSTSDVWTCAYGQDWNWGTTRTVGLATESADVDFGIASTLDIDVIMGWNPTGRSWSGESYHAHTSFGPGLSADVGKGHLSLGGSIGAEVGITLGWDKTNWYKDDLYRCHNTRLTDHPECCMIQKFSSLLCISDPSFLQGFSIVSLNTQNSFIAPAQCVACTMALAAAANDIAAPVDYIELNVGRGISFGSKWSTGKGPGSVSAGVTLTNEWTNAYTIECAPPDHPPGHKITFAPSNLCSYNYIPCEVGTYSVSAVHECTKCPAGRYQNEEGKANCIDCVVGRYQDQIKQASCIDCVTGRYQDQPGQPDCIDCVVGRYQDQIEQTDCTDCVAGRYQDQSGQPDCIDCVPGRYQDQIEKTDCIDCVAGRYQDQSGQPSCPKCFNGHETTKGVQPIVVGATRCRDCPIGKSDNDQGSQSECVVCDKGQYQDQTGQTYCRECTAGRFLNFDNTNAADHDNSNDCRYCPGGRYTDQKSQSVCKVSCAVGKYHTVTGQNTKAECYECPSGYYQKFNGTEKCTKCGYYWPSRFDDLAALDGHTDQPIDRLVYTENEDVKKYWVEDGRHSFDMLKDHWLYNNSDNGKLQVLDYQNEHGQTSCKRCDSGSGVSNSAAPNNELSIKVVIPLALYSTASNAHKLYSTASNAHKTSDAHQTCGQCAAGMYNPYDNFVCVQCLPGRYQDQLGKHYCKLCPGGWGHDIYGSIHHNTCQQCDGGKYQNKGIVLQGGYTFPTERGPNGAKDKFMNYAWPGTLYPEFYHKQALWSQIMYFESVLNPDQRDNYLDFKYPPRASNRVGPHEEAACKQCSVNTVSFGVGIQSRFFELFDEQSTPYQWSFFYDGNRRGTYLDFLLYNIGLRAGRYDDDWKRTFGETMFNYVGCEACSNGQVYNSTSSKCEVCPHDTTFDSGTCVSCPTGRTTHNPIYIKDWDDRGFTALQYKNGVDRDSVVYFDLETSDTCTGAGRGKYEIGFGRYLDNYGNDFETTLKMECKCACKDGTWIKNWWDKSACNQCPAGSGARSKLHTFEYNADQCAECPAGKFSEEGQACINCPIGKYQLQTGQSNCTECPVNYGHYDSIPSNNTWEDGRKVCLVCPRGYASQAGSQCNRCQNGKYSRTGGTNCIDCPSGWQSGEHSWKDSGHTLCLECPQGKFLLNTSKTCNSCSAGQYQGERGKTNCKDCESGMYSPDGSSGCTQCPSRQYQNEIGQSSCKYCEQGKYSAIGSSGCTECPNSWIYQTVPGCAECADGKKVTDNSSISDRTCQVINCNDGYGVDYASRTCVQCHEGYFSSLTLNHNQCLNCPNAWYQEQVGQTDCNACPAGYGDDYKTNVGCLACEGRREQRSLNKIHYSNQAIYSIGKFSGEGTGCKTCASGKYQDEDGQVESSCKQCPYGTKGPYWWDDACSESCDNGMYMSESGCTNCQTGQYSTTLSMYLFYYSNLRDTYSYTTKSWPWGCQDCSAGRGSKNKAATDLDCGACPFGKYSQGDGEGCQDCSAGRGSKNQAVSLTDCGACPSGKYSGDGQSCQDCSAGRGSKNQAVSLTDCGACFSGKYSQVDGQGCLDCSYGQFQNATGQTNCISCPDHKATTLQLGATSTDNCSQYLTTVETDIHVQIVSEICSSDATFPMCNISVWNLENITILKSAFKNRSDFNADISKWDVSKVTDMSEMFQGATNFNADISKWDVSKVTDMSEMFQGATKFEPIRTAHWDVSNVEDMTEMFVGTNLSVVLNQTVTISNLEPKYLLWNYQKAIQTVGLPLEKANLNLGSGGQFSNIFFTCTSLHVTGNCIKYANRNPYTFQWSCCPYDAADCGTQVKCKNCALNATTCADITCNSNAYRVTGAIIDKWNGPYADGLYKAATLANNQNNLLVPFAANQNTYDIPIVGQQRFWGPIYDVGGDAATWGKKRTPNDIYFDYNLKIDSKPIQGWPIKFWDPMYNPNVFFRFGGNRCKNKCPHGHFKAQGQEYPFSTGGVCQSVCTCTNGTPAIDCDSPMEKCANCNKKPWDVTSSEVRRYFASESGSELVSNIMSYGGGGYNQGIFSGFMLTGNFGTTCVSLKCPNGTYLDVPAYIDGSNSYHSPSCRNVTNSSDVFEHGEFGPVLIRPCIPMYSSVSGACMHHDNTSVNTSQNDCHTHGLCTMTSKLTQLECTTPIVSLDSSADQNNNNDAWVDCHAQTGVYVTGQCSVNFEGRVNTWQSANVLDDYKYGMDWCMYKKDVFIGWGPPDDHVLMKWVNATCTTSFTPGTWNASRPTGITWTQATPVQYVQDGKQCNACAEGKFHNSALHECVNCPSGWIPRAGQNQASCVACPPGRGSNMDGDSCQQCRGTMFSNQDGGSCQECQPEQLSSPNRTFCMDKCNLSVTELRTSFIEFASTTTECYLPSIFNSGIINMRLSNPIKNGRVITVDLTHEIMNRDDILELRHGCYPETCPPCSETNGSIPENVNICSESQACFRSTCVDVNGCGRDSVTVTEVNQTHMKVNNENNECSVDIGGSVLTLSVGKTTFDFSDTICDADGCTTITAGNGTTCYYGTDNECPCVGGVCVCNTGLNEDVCSCGGMNECAASSYCYDTSCFEVKQCDQYNVTEANDTKITIHADSPCVVTDLVVDGNKEPPFSIFEESVHQITNDNCNICGHQPVISYQNIELVLTPENMCYFNNKNCSCTVGDTVCLCGNDESDSLCRCGLKTCPSGEYCDHVNSFCYKEECISGTELLPAEYCKCGDNACNSEQLCEGGQCVYPDCYHADGINFNIGHCNCGGQTCFELCFQNSTFSTCPQNQSIGLQYSNSPRLCSPGQESTSNDSCDECQIGQYSLLFNDVCKECQNNWSTYKVGSDQCYPVILSEKNEIDYDICTSDVILNETDVMYEVSKHSYKNCIENSIVDVHKPAVWPVRLPQQLGAPVGESRYFVSLNCSRKFSTSCQRPHQPTREWVKNKYKSLGGCTSSAVYMDLCDITTTWNGNVCVNLVEGMATTQPTTTQIATLYNSDCSELDICGNGTTWVETAKKCTIL